MLGEIDQSTVTFRPNYDGSKTEPIVPPARIPNLLINGADGIAVGMATNIPPQQPQRGLHGLQKLLDNPDLTSVQLARYVKDLDFPTGGQILNSPEELRRSTNRIGRCAPPLDVEEGPVTKGSKTIFITSVPHTVNKATLVERIADVALSRKLPPLLDVKDLDRRRPHRARAEKGCGREDGQPFLFKHTPLQTSFIGTSPA
jgi:DNA gyrase subunit A